MSGFTDLPKEIRYMFISQYIGVFLFIVLMIFQVPWYMDVALLSLYIVGYQNWMMKREKNARETLDGLRHVNSYTLRDNDYREDHIYSFRSVIPLSIHETIPIRIEDIPEYQECEQEERNERRLITISSAQRELINFNSQELDVKAQKEAQKKEEKEAKEQQKKKEEFALTPEDEKLLDAKIAAKEDELKTKSTKSTKKKKGEEAHE